MPPAPKYVSAEGATSPARDQSRTLGIVAAVLGGLALLLSIIPLVSILLALASATCAIIALVRRQGGKVLAFVGIGLSVVALAIAITVMVIAINIMQQQGAL
jgi:uncharacterized membrane protein YccC